MLQTMRRARVILIFAAFVAACGEDPVEPGPDPEANEPVYDPLRHLVSNPISASAAADGKSAAAEEETVAYVSLLPETYPAGVAADIRNAANGYQMSVTLENGGFDPVTVPSAVGDTLFISISDSSGTIIGSERAVVRPEVPPLIVRTRPGKGKVDVPLNLLSVTVVFSEPIDRSTVTAQTIRLHRGSADGVQLDGEVVLQANGFVADLMLASPLEPGTRYTIVVTTGIRDLAGDALPNQEVVNFETLGIVAYVVVSRYREFTTSCGCTGLEPTDQVVVIDTKTHTLTKTIDFGDAATPPGSPAGLASWSDVMFIPNRPFAYLTGWVTVVIDAATHEVTGPVVFVYPPPLMTASEDGRFVYFARGRVAVVSTDIHEVVANIPVLGGRGGTYALAPSPDGSVVYAAVWEAALDESPVYSIKVIDLVTNAVVASTPLPSGAWRILFSPDGAFAYAVSAGGFDPDDGRVYVLDTSDHSLVTTIVMGILGDDVVLSPDGAYLLVSDLGHRTITVIETATNSVVGQIDGVQARALLLSPDGSRLYAGDTDAKTVWVIDVVSMSVVTGVAVDLTATARPYLAVTPDGAFVYVGNGGTNAVAVIDTETNTVVAEIDVGGPIKDIAITPR